jgi:hypothetical protein
MLEQSDAGSQGTDDPVKGMVEPTDLVSLDLGSAPDAAEIERIRQLADPVLRNLRITLAYARLSRAMRRVLGPEHANWCTFATWASKRAGRTIRGEELRAQLRRRLRHDRTLQATLRELQTGSSSRRDNSALQVDQIEVDVLDLVRYASSQVAEGNLKVFAELAPAFSQLITLFDGEGRLDQEKLQRFVAQFRPGDTPDGGQALLRAAFTHYGQAIFESNPKAKAQLMLLANDQVGLHEQTRLQPNIAGAIEGPLQLLRERLARHLRLGWWFWWRRPRERQSTELLAAVHQIWREEVTWSLMDLPLPGEALNLGRDLPTRPGQAMFPPLLRELENDELIRLLRQYDRTWDTTDQTGARDWTSLGDRMHYIADLFRARQQEPSLFQLPFSVEQCQTIARGEVPLGEL